VSVSDSVIILDTLTLSDGVSVSAIVTVTAFTVDSTSDGVSVSDSVIDTVPLLMLKAITDHFPPSPFQSKVSLSASLRISPELR